jgi:DTW domain-containing protein YfiP
MPHAVARLAAERLARSSKPFLARGGSRRVRCAGCRLPASHCICALRPPLAADAGVCLLMHDIEPLKPSNTGWLIADMLPDTFAFGWARTQAAPALLALLADPAWQPYVVFPGEFVAPERVVHALAPAPEPAPGQPRRRPLFVLLDATWPQATKMLRKSPYLDGFPVLSLQGGTPSRYRLRRSHGAGHLCTAEVAAHCLALAGAPDAGAALLDWLDLFGARYLLAREQRPVAQAGDNSALAAQPPNPSMD